MSSNPNTALIERRTRSINLAFLWRLSIKTYHLQMWWDVQKLHPYKRTDFKIQGGGGLVTQTYRNQLRCENGPPLKKAPKIKQANYSQRISRTMDSHWIKKNQRISRNTCNLGLSIDGYSGIYFTPDVWGGQLRFVARKLPRKSCYLWKLRLVSIWSETFTAWQKVEKRKTKLTASISSINWV